MPRWGNLVPSYMSGSALIVLSIQIQPWVRPCWRGVWVGVGGRGPRPRLVPWDRHVSKPWRISYRSKDNLWAQSSLRTPSVIEGEWRRSALPGNQSAFQHLAHVYSFSFLKPFKTGRFFFFFFINFSLRSEFTLNPSWNCSIWYGLAHGKVPVYVCFVHDIFYY